jgi:hypothetical protein
MEINNNNLNFKINQKQKEECGNKVRLSRKEEVAICVETKMFLEKNNTSEILNRKGREDRKKNRKEKKTKYNFAVELRRNTAFLLKNNTYLHKLLTTKYNHKLKTLSLPNSVLFPSFDVFQLQK